MREISSVNQVKNHNVELIKSALKSIESGTKNVIAQMTGLSVATCNTILNELAETGEILETESVAPSIGRPPKSYRFNESFAYVLCLFTNEEGALTINSAVTDLMGTILTDDTRSYRHIDEHTIIDYIEEQIEEEPKIRYISLGISGFYYDGRVQSSGIDNLNGIDLKTLIEKRFNLPVTIENDTNAMALGVYSFADELVESKNDMALLAYFKDIQPGCGIVIDGKVHMGNTRFAGEVCHLVYKNFDVFTVDENNKTTFHSLESRNVVESASTSVISLCCTVNPELIVFTGEAIDNDIIEEIKRFVSRYIPKEHMPIIKYGEDVRQYYFWGLCAEALDNSR
ncbi:MAG: ROK family protein [Clostridia bacterium]|nr:ROK family protein [Clostridia bacterium]